MQCSRSDQGDETVVTIDGKLRRYGGTVQQHGVNVQPAEIFRLLRLDKVFG